MSVYYYCQFYWKLQLAKYYQNPTILRIVRALRNASSVLHMNASLWCFHGYFGSAERCGSSSSSCGRVVSGRAEWESKFWLLFSPVSFFYYFFLVVACVEFLFVCIGFKFSLWLFLFFTAKLWLAGPLWRLTASPDSGCSENSNALWFIGNSGFSVSEYRFSVTLSQLPGWRTPWNLPIITPSFPCSWSLQTPGRGWSAPIRRWIKPQWELLSALSTFFLHRR